jgi:hypothetical protein
MQNHETSKLNTVFLLWAKLQEMKKLKIRYLMSENLY